MKDGSSFSALRELRRGDPEDPFDWQQLQARMRAFAPAMTDTQAARLTHWCAAFGDASNDDLPCRPVAELFGG